MSDKQIFAALEVADHEVRLVVGEFFNTRFNIIKVERVPCSGLTYNQVIDPEAVTNSVKKAVENAKKMIGSDVHKVIVAMPSCGMKRYSFKSTVDIDGIDHTVTLQDVRNAISRAEAQDIGKNYALIQTVCVKYTVNGISSRRIPLGEKCDKLTVDVDLLCAARKLSYDLVGCIEAAGLKIIDIFLDVFTAGKEAALFEQAVNRQVIILKMERESTTLGLLRKGRLTTGTVIPGGVGTIAGALTDQYGINTDMAVDLVKYSAQLDDEEPSENPVHIWSEKGVTNTLNEKQLNECILERVNSWIDMMSKTCEQILQAGETTVIITGEGGEMQGLDVLLSRSLNTEVRNYIPDTLGGRNAALTSCLGLFYAYQDKQPISGYVDDSIDLEAFIKSVSYRDKKNDGNTKEDTLTNKLKGLFLEGKK